MLKTANTGKIWWLFSDR